MKLLVTLGAFIFAGMVGATPLHNMVVFGDSLSDNGNLYEYMKHQLPQSPPYFEGRFTNGPVWIEHLISSYFPNNPAQHLLDFAVGGAGVSVNVEDDEIFFTLRRQLNAYFLTHEDKSDPDSLYVIWIGANNYLGLPEEVEETLNIVNNGITESIQRLVDKGAKHILVLNLPDLGKTPAAIEFGSIDKMTYFSSHHNAALAKTMENLKQVNPGVEWLYFDMGSMFSEVLDHASEYGFNNTTGTCADLMINEREHPSVLQMVASAKPLNRGDACEGYLFFDLVHPTALAHKILADKAKVLLDAAGIEFSDS
jgi:phospholipase/lecithinase/hemolysin